MPLDELISTFMIVSHEIIQPFSHLLKINKNCNIYYPHVQTVIMRFIDPDDGYLKEIKKLGYFIDKSSFFSAKLSCTDF